MQAEFEKAVKDGRPEAWGDFREGRLSLVEYGKPLPGYFARSEEEGWEPFRPFAAVPQIDWNDPDLRFVDLDGDGLAAAGLPARLACEF